jgi:hypothetical protein
LLKFYYKFMNCSKVQTDVSDIAQYYWIGENIQNQLKLDDPNDANKPTAILRKVSYYTLQLGNITSPQEAQLSIMQALLRIAKRNMLDQVPSIILTVGREIKTTVIRKFLQSNFQGSDNDIFRSKTNADPTIKVVIVTGTALDNMKKTVCSIPFQNSYFSNTKAFLGVLKTAAVQMKSSISIEKEKTPIKQEKKSSSSGKTKRSSPVSLYEMSDLNISSQESSNEEEESYRRSSRLSSRAKSSVSSQKDRNYHGTHKHRSSSKSSSRRNADSGYKTPSSYSRS